MSDTVLLWDNDQGAAVPAQIGVALSPGEIGTFPLAFDHGAACIQSVGRDLDGQPVVIDNIKDDTGLPRLLLAYANLLSSRRMYLGFGDESSQVLVNGNNGNWRLPKRG